MCESTRDHCERAATRAALFKRRGRFFEAPRRRHPCRAAVASRVASRVTVVRRARARRRRRRRAGAHTHAHRPFERREPFERHDRSFLEDLLDKT